MQSVVESNSVVFNCSVNGLTSPVFTWYSNIDGALVMLTASSNIVIQQTTQGDMSYSTLTLVSAARTDAGQYVCSVTSQTTNGTTTASLTVYCEYMCINDCHFILMVYLFSPLSCSYHLPTASGCGGCTAKHCYIHLFS